MGQALRLISNLIMTQLLAPEDFALVAIVFAIHVGLVMMSDVGLKQSVIRFDHGDQPDFLRTVWTMQALQVVLLGIVLGGTAWGLQAASGRMTSIGGVFADSHLPALLAASIPILLLQGLQSMNVVLAQRRFIVKPVIAIELIRQLCALAAMIGWALWDPSAWAIVVGSTVGATVSCVLSHLTLPGPAMRLRWVSTYAQEVWDYGKWLVGASAAGFVENQGDRFVLGALLSTEAFGLYAVAMVWIEAIGALAMSLLHQIGQPMLNEVKRSSSDRLDEILRQLRRAADLLAVAGFLGAYFLAFVLLQQIYPEPFHAAVPIMAVLAVKLLTLRYIPLTYFADSTGETRRLFISKVPVLAMVFLGIPSAYMAFGMPGALLASASAKLVSVPLQLSIVARHLPLNRERERMEMGALIGAAVLWTAMVD